MRDAVAILADHRRLHPVIQHFAGAAADGLKGVDVAAQNGALILMQAKPAPQPTAMAQHHGKKPENADNTGLIGKFAAELRKVYLCLATRRGLETHFKARRWGWPDAAQKVGHGAITTLVAKRLDIPHQPFARQARMGAHPFAQIILKRGKQAWSRKPRAIGRCC